MPVTPPNTPSRKRRKRPLLPNERKAETLFDYSNAEWAATWLPPVRLAAVQVAVDDAELTRILTELIADGEVDGLLGGMIRTQQHLAGLQGMLEAALTRSFIALERLGYTPDNPPPERERIS